MSWGRAIDETRLCQTAHQAVRLLIDLRLGRLVVLAFVLMVGMVMGAAANDLPISFDIPSQPLESALEIYSRATGREVLYNSDLIRDHTSPSLAGVLNPDAALERLLVGSGLAPRYLADRSFVLLPTPVAAPAGQAEVSSPAITDRYYALIQESLRKALCASDRGRPGGYRLAALLWIGPSGTVERHERLDSLSTDADVATETNAGINQVLDHLAIGEPPPAGFAQPVTIAVVPRADGVTMGCSSRRDDRAGSGSGHG
jgi:hypothetical protein